MRTANSWKLKICKHFQLVGNYFTIIISRAWGSTCRRRDASNTGRCFWKFIFFSNLIITIADWVEHLCGLFNLFLTLLARIHWVPIFQVPPTFRPAAPSVVRWMPPRVPPCSAQRSCTRGCTQDAGSIWSSSSWKIRTADTVDLKIVYGQLLKVPPTEVLTPRARLSEVRSPSRREAFLYEPRSWRSMVRRRWNIPGITKPHSSLPNLSESNLRSLKFHLADRPDDQARHPNLAGSALSHRTGRLTYPIEPFDKVRRWTWLWKTDPKYQSTNHPL